MDVKYLNPFLAAIQNVFETMIGIPYNLGNPTLKKDKIASYDVSGVIGISGEVAGCVVISFPKATALQLASALLDDDLQTVDEDCTDAIGEIANMIAGDAKKNFPKKNTSVSVPIVIIGKSEIVYPSAVPIFSIPCNTSDGQFVVEVALKVS